MVEKKMSNVRFGLGFQNHNLQRVSSLRQFHLKGENEGKGCEFLVNSEKCFRRNRR